MTSKSYAKTIVQIKGKKDKLKKYLKHNKPKTRTYGKITKKCELCKNTHGRIGKYKINICRQCFRENATKMGFKKYS